MIVGIKGYDLVVFTIILSVCLIYPFNNFLWVFEFTSSYHQAWSNSSWAVPLNKYTDKEINLKVVFIIYQSTTN